ncbi:MAG: hypothetical protein ACRCV9_09780 [Burkholderiaceae bacterium]
MARRPFFEVLRDLRGGEPIDELAAKMQELTQAVQSTGGSGRLTLTLDVSPMKGSTEAVIVKDTIAVKKPEIKSKGTLMFPTVEGNLQRTNPAQRELPGITLAADKAAANA